MTTTEADAILIARSAGGFEDYTADADFANTFAESGNFALGHKILTGTGTHSWTATSAGNTGVANVIAAYKGAAGGGGRFFLLVQP